MSGAVEHPSPCWSREPGRGSHYGENTGGPRPQPQGNPHSAQRSSPTDCIRNAQIRSEYAFVTSRNQPTVSDVSAEALRIQFYSLDGGSMVGNGASGMFDDTYFLDGLRKQVEQASIVSPSSSAYSRVPETGYHPLAVAYESIAQVYLSTTTTEQRPQVGFNW